MTAEPEFPEWLAQAAIGLASGDIDAGWRCTPRTPYTSSRSRQSAP